MIDNRRVEKREKYIYICKLLYLPSHKIHDHKRNSLKSSLHVGPGFSTIRSLPRQMTTKPALSGLRVSILLPSRILPNLIPCDTFSYDVSLERETTRNWKPRKAILQCKAHYRMHKRRWSAINLFLARCVTFTRY